jgi:hypothetical protein
MDVFGVLTCKWTTFIHMLVTFFCQLMAASQKMYAVFKQPLYGGGDHESDQVFFTLTWKSSYRYMACTKLLRSARNDDTPDKPQHTLSASDATNEVLYRERQFNLPELTSNGPLNVWIETVRLNGKTTINLVEKLLLTANLAAKVTQLQSDAILKAQISELKTLCPPSQAIQKQQLGLVPPNLELCHTTMPW